MIGELVSNDARLAGYRTTKQRLACLKMDSGRLPMYLLRGDVVRIEG